MATTKTLTTFQKLSAIQQEIKVNKSQYNSFGKYYYRSAEDILEALKPMEGKYNVTFYIDDEIAELESAERDLVYITADAVMVNNDDVDDDGYYSRISVSGHAIIDFEAKGMQMPQRTGAASSYAKKYALGNLLLLDDVKDSDATNQHGKGKGAPASPPRPTVKKAKIMSKAQKDSFLKGISEGKFSQVESFLVGFDVNDTNTLDVKEALTKAKSGK